MSLGSVIKSIFSNSTVKAVEGIVLTDTEKAVVALRKEPIAQIIFADISTATSTALSGPAKFEQVLAQTLPALLTIVTTGGLKAELADVEDIGRALVQSIYNDSASTQAATVARTILAVLKVA